MKFYYIPRKNTPSHNKEKQRFERQLNLSASLLTLKTLFFLIIICAKLCLTIFVLLLYYIFVQKWMSFSESCFARIRNEDMNDFHSRHLWEIPLELFSPIDILDFFFKEHVAMNIIMFFCDQKLWSVLHDWAKAKNMETIAMTKNLFKWLSCRRINLDINFYKRGEHFLQDYLKKL